MAPPSRPLAERFWEKVDRRGPDECWPWLAAMDKDGYGRFKGEYDPALGHGRMFRSNRFAWFLTFGTEPAGLICHTCDNPPCCNPAHLYDGTPKTNGADVATRERHPKRQQTYCSRGHEFTPENTILKANGTRKCRACHNARRNTGLGRGFRSDLHQQGENMTGSDR